MNSQSEVEKREMSSACGRGGIHGGPAGSTGAPADTPLASQSLPHIPHIRVPVFFVFFTDSNLNLINNWGQIDLQHCSTTTSSTCELCSSTGLNNTV